MEEIEATINRFIDAMARRKDPVLNKFFSEVISTMQPVFNKQINEQEDSVKADILEYENARLKMMLSLFTEREYHEYDYSVLEVLKGYSMKAKNLYNTYSFYLDADLVWMIQVVCRMKGIVPVYPKRREDLDSYLKKIF